MLGNFNEGVLHVPVCINGRVLSSEVLPNKLESRELFLDGVSGLLYYGDKDGNVKTFRSAIANTLQVNTGGSNDPVDIYIDEYTDEADGITRSLWFKIPEVLTSPYNRQTLTHVPTLRYNVDGTTTTTTFAHGITVTDELVSSSVGAETQVRAGFIQAPRFRVTSNNGYGSEPPTITGDYAEGSIFFQILETEK